MRLDKIDLNLFVVFDAIYREKSVTKVAVLLNLTQPAVSNALNRLRETFDDPLFVRSSEGMSPTPVADNVVSDVRQALTLLGDSVGINAKFDPLISEKVFKVGMNDLAGAMLLPRLLLLAKEVAPKISITNYYVDRDTATEDLKAGIIDVLLDAPTVNAKSLSHRAVAAIPYVIAMRSGHPAEQCKLTLEEYLSWEHMHVSSRRKGRGQMDVALHAIGKQRRIAMKAQNYLVAAKVVEGSDLLWAVPELLIGTLSLATKPSPVEVEPLRWNMYWHETAEKDPANCWFRELLAQVVGEIV
ncbi:hypothetical protein A9Q99_04085 [Gammaproteobacteria bacterium 45_16_T64]|nr:hypothetical protein A9Q99_04085 [Gammaproteobacteria bacterium 45_16_T64]